MFNYCLNSLSFSSVAVDFDHFQILRAIGKGSFGKVSGPTLLMWSYLQLYWLHHCTIVQDYGSPIYVSIESVKTAMIYFTNSLEICQMHKSMWNLHKQSNDWLFGYYLIIAPQLIVTGSLWWIFHTGPADGLVPLTNWGWVGINNLNHHWLR